MGPGIYTRITPVVSWSWNMAGEPAGDTWHPSHRVNWPGVAESIE
ncbi:hypothetical protein ACFOY2_38880 [Nonomuraea purpurea]|uniref:Uncharacterized protein n=1 Tax=Nonomuraea purpurea TaxID=1849276 RepID=A0ABV8GJQ4_9ACTN